MTRRQEFIGVLALLLLVLLGSAYLVLAELASRTDRQPAIIRLK